MNEILRLLRNAYNYTLDDLAKILGISKQYLSEIERGTRRPTDEIIKKYSNTFEIDEETIRYFKDNNTDISIRLKNALESIVIGHK